MDFTKIQRRKPAPQQPLVISPVHEEDPNFSFHENNGFSKPPTSSSQARLYPQTTRSKVNDHSSDAMQFIDFVKRMGRNDSSRTALQHGQLSNSNFRGFRSSRRSETEGNEGGSTSTLPVRIDDQTSQEGKLGPNDEKASTKGKNQFQEHSRQKLQPNLSRELSEVGSLASVAALENDVKYLQRSLLLKDEQIEILKKEKDLMTKRYIKEADSMQGQINDLRVRLTQYEKDTGPPTLNAEIQRIKRQLQQSKMTRRSSVEKLSESFVRKRSCGPDASRSEARIDSESKIKLELESKMSECSRRSGKSNRSKFSKFSKLEQRPVPGLTGQEDKEVLIKMLQQYDLANRELTRSLAQLNDQIAFLQSQRQRFETLIFELQNENTLFKTQLSQQEEMLGRYQSKRMNLSRTLNNLRKFG